MAKNIYVKPIGERWGVLEMTLAESFIDDWRRFSFKTAVYNLVCQWAIPARTPEQQFVSDELIRALSEVPTDLRVSWERGVFPDITGCCNVSIGAICRAALDEIEGNSASEFLQPDSAWVPKSAQL
jgi:porphobilinogen deaminase